MKGERVRLLIIDLVKKTPLKFVYFEGYHRGYDVGHSDGYKMGYKDRCTDERADRYG